MNKIIIDADPGVDDTFAILLAAKSKFIDLLGISIVAGNCGLENGIRNTFKVLDMCDKNHIPVYKGSEVSLEVNHENATYVHGKNGFGDLEYEPIIRSTNGDAIDYLIRTVNENPGEITIVATGPLTNIALAIMKDNNFAKNIKSLIIMGSTKVKGNATKFSEFNFHFDPDATKKVFDSEIKDIVLFGLNVTHKLYLSDEQELYLKNNSNPIGNILYKITRLGSKFDKEHGLKGLCLHDPLTVAYLINNNVAKVMNADLEIITEGEMIGRSNIMFKEDGRCKVAYEVDRDLFFELLFDTIIEDK